MPMVMAWPFVALVLLGDESATKQDVETFAGGFVVRKEDADAFKAKTYTLNFQKLISAGNTQNEVRAVAWSDLAAVFAALKKDEEEAKQTIKIQNDKRAADDRRKGTKVPAHLVCFVEPFSPEILSHAEAKLNTAKTNQKAIRDAVAKEVQLLRPNRMGSLDEFLAQQIEMADKAIVDATTLDQHELLKAIDSLQHYLSSANTAAAYCNKAQEEYAVIPKIDLLANDVQMDFEILSVSKNLTAAQKQLLEKKQQDIANRTSNRAEAVLLTVEPASLSGDEIAVSTDKLSIASNRIKAQAFCRGVLSAQCFEAYEFCINDQSSSAAEKEILAVALDRSPIASRIVFLRDLLPQNSKATPQRAEIFQQVAVSVQNDLRGLSIAELQGVLDDFVTRGELDLYAQVLGIAFTYTNDRQPLVENALRVLARRPHAETLAILLQYSDASDLPGLRKIYTRLNSRDQIRLSEAMIQSMTKYRDSVLKRVDAAVRESQPSKDLATKFTGSKAEATQGFQDVLVALEQDRALNLERARQNTGEVERLIKILPNGSEIQRRMAVELSKFYLQVFGDSDAALNALSLCDAPIDSEVLAASKDFAGAFRRILDLDLVRLSREQDVHTAYADFIEKAYLPAIEGTQVEALSEVERQNLKNIIQARRTTETQIAERLQALERAQIKRIQAMRDLIQKWTSKISSKPTEWLKGFDSLQKELGGA